MGLKFLFKYLIILVSFVGLTGFVKQEKEIQTSGVSFSDLNLFQPDSSTFKLSNYKGNIVYINLWSTICPAAREIISAVDNLAKDIKEDSKFIEKDKIKIVNVCVGKTWKKWNMAMELYPSSNQQLYLEPEIFKDFTIELGFRGFPQFIILDENGDILTQNAKGPSSIKSTLRVLAKEIK
jgi:thiol-disulfide isomerase/thioredoxin